MDHVVRQKLNEIRRKQLESQENTPVTNPSSSAKDNSKAIAALGGVAAGLTIAIIAWLMHSILTTDKINIIAPQSHVSINASRIREANEQIDQLNNRVVSLTESISNLESRLTRTVDKSSPTTGVEMNLTSFFQDDTTETAGEEPKPDAIEHDTPSVADLLPKAEDAFVPTHIATTRLNLRPKASLDAAPIVTLGAGTVVEYIREDDDWYYVNTALHGKGWCASDYLSPM